MSKPAAEPAGAPSQRYAVDVERTADGAHAEARVRDFTLTTGARRGDPTVGPNAVETLLAAAGTCLLTSLGGVAEASRVDLQSASIALEAERQDRPPRLTVVRYVLRVAADVDDDRLGRLIDLAERNSTVLGTLGNGPLPVEGRWERL